MSIWTIANEHGEWTTSIGDVITFLDSIPNSHHLIWRSGILNTAPTLDGSASDVPVKDLPVLCTRNGGRDPTIIVVSAADVIEVQVDTAQPI